MQSTDVRRSAALALAVLGDVLHSAAMVRPPVRYTAALRYAQRSRALRYPVVRRNVLHRVAVICGRQRRYAKRSITALSTALRRYAGNCIASPSDAITSGTEGCAAMRSGVQKFCALKRAVPYRMPARRINMQCIAVHVLHCIACIAVLGWRYVGYMQDTDSSASSARGAIGAIAGSGNSGMDIGYRKGSPEI